ncbi:LINE-1 retrotransposable element orf2 protein [Plakobranchus ocellatus]|uniref:LINE-1 retrotransposable element orf2 protein n=1 Tax=Plakobranchus ocellatus TaxID=259542 RepID=A0AAV3Z3U7_9GAST|nr:LINE-1 retrotransposable element orf2 protein [Plakobranchus ocellatus]
MNNGKAKGPDNILAETIKASDNLGIGLTTKLLDAINDSGTVPEDLCKSVFIVLLKTPGATECELHRTISLMSHFTTILFCVLMHRMRKSLRPEISPNQFGFMPDKGTRNAIITLSMLMERYADDTVLIAESGKQLQKLLDTVVFESERMGLALNVKETEGMVISKKSPNLKCNLVSKGEQIKQVTKFKYLGYLITSDAQVK